MAKGKTNPFLMALIVGVVTIFFGGAVLGFGLILASNDPENIVFTIMTYGGGAVAAVGLITLVVGVISGKRHQKGASTKPVNAKPEAIADVNFQLDGTNTYTVEPTPVPQTDNYEFVTVGRKQSLEDKFEQIGKMGKTQFVIYIAKLFSLKGYEVQLTPVIDNNNIDMLVKRDGVTRVVGCLLANKVMCEEDITPVYNGRSFYTADGVMIVTNMYFDRTSLNFAKSHKINLVDRNVLAEQFMN